MITLRALSQDNPDILLVKELYIHAFPLRERLDLRSLFEVMPAPTDGSLYGCLCLEPEAVEL